MSNTPHAPIIIKRYASRKLYDPQAKVYVTLDDVARYIAEGHDVRIIDKKTEEDLTGQYLVQIIAERENKGNSPLPVSVLTDLVRLYHDRTCALTPAFLTQAVEAFAEQQKKVVDTISDPAKVMSAMQQWQAQQSKMFAEAMNMATGGFAGRFASPSKGQAKDQAKDQAAPDNTAPDNTARQADPRMDALEAQLAALQNEIQRMK